MTLPDVIYERCTRLPDAAAQEALDFIDFLSQRYASVENTVASDDAVSYDKWFRSQVQRALDDPRPGISDEEVRAHFFKRRQSLSQPPENRT